MWEKKVETVTIRKTKLASLVDKQFASDYEFSLFKAQEGFPGPSGANLDAEVEEEPVNCKTEVVQKLNAIARFILKVKKTATCGLARYSTIEAYGRRCELTKSYYAQWSKSCLFPYVGFLQGFYGNHFGTSKRVVFSRDFDERVVETLEIVYAALLWGLSARIYVIESGLEEVFGDVFVPLSSPIHYKVLANLPDWCVYIATPSRKINQTAISGFFAYVDFEPNHGLLLNLVFLAANMKPIVVRLSLKEGQSYAESIVNEEIATDLWKQFSKENPQLIKKQAFYPESLSRQEKEQAVAFAIPRLLALCTQNTVLLDIKHNRQVKRLLLEAEKQTSAPLKFNDRNRSPSLLIVSLGSDLESDMTLSFETDPETQSFDLVIDAEAFAEADALAAQPEPEHNFEHLSNDDKDSLYAAALDIADRLEAEKDRLAKELGESQAKVKEFALNLDRATEENRLLRIQCNAAQDQIKQAEVLKASLVAEVENLQASNAAVVAEYETLKTEVDSVLVENIDLKEKARALEALVEPQKSRLATLTAMAQDLKTQNDVLTERMASGDKYLDQYLNLSAEHETALGELSNLRSEVQSLKHALNEAQAQIVNLSTENAKKALALQDKQAAPSSLVEEGAESEIFRKLFFTESLTATEVLKLFETLFRRRVTVLPSAWESARKIDHSYKNTKELIKMLFLLVNDYLREYIAGGDNKARHVFGSKYCAQESERLQKTENLIRDRVFSGIRMLQHLRISYTVRLYFAVDVAKERIIIGYCGNHLETIDK